MNTTLRYVIAKTLPRLYRTSQLATLTTESGKAFNHLYNNADTEPKTLSTDRRYFRFCLPRSLNSVEEVEQVINYFRRYGRVIMYRLSRVSY
jgi:hypothetical protein